MKRFPSKIGAELSIPLAIILGSVAWLMIVEKVWPGVAIIGIASLFIGHLFLTTYYQIDGHSLLIKSGFIYTNTVDIRTIRKITATRSPLSAPAISLDRLDISYNTFDGVVVSPADKAGFIRELLRVNPAIAVKV